MKHDRFREWLYLSAFDELGEGERHRLAQHLVSCDECQREREEIVRMLESITASGAGEPSEEMLQSARESLRAALSREPRIQPPARESLSHPSFVAARDRRDASFLGGWFRRYRPAFAMAATFAFGLVLGYFVYDRLNTAPTVGPAMPMTSDSYTGITNVRFVDADAADGEVDVVYDQTRPMRLKTRIDDERMREVLAFALLNGENPGVRLGAINVFETDESGSPLADMKHAFVEALITDPNAGVRKQALLILQRLPFDDDIKRALLFVLLHDENPGIRITAMNYLAEIAIEGAISEQEMYDILNARATQNPSQSVQTEEM